LRDEKLGVNIFEFPQTRIRHVEESFPFQSWPFWPRCAQFQAKPDGGKNLLQALAAYGPPEISSNKLYEIEAQTRQVLQPFFDATVGKSMKDFDILFLNGEAGFAGIMAYEKKAAPVLILDRKMLSYIKAEDHLLAVSGHEVAHKKRGEKVSLSRFQRWLQGMSEEDLVDGKTILFLANTGGNSSQ